MNVSAKVAHRLLCRRIRLIHLRSQLQRLPNFDRLTGSDTRQGRGRTGGARRLSPRLSTNGDPLQRAIPSSGWRPDTLRAPPNETVKAHTPQNGVVPRVVPDGVDEWMVELHD